MLFEINHQLFRYKNNACDEQSFAFAKIAHKKELMAQIVVEICLYVHSCVEDNPSNSLRVWASKDLFLQWAGHRAWSPTHPFYSAQIIKWKPWIHEYRLRCFAEIE